MSPLNSAYVRYSQLLQCTTPEGSTGLLCPRRLTPLIHCKKPDIHLSYLLTKYSDSFCPKPFCSSYPSRCSRTVRLSCRCASGGRCMARSELGGRLKADQSRAVPSCTCSRCLGLSTETSKLRSINNLFIIRIVHGVQKSIKSLKNKKIKKDKIIIIKIVIIMGTSVWVMVLSCHERTFRQF